MPESIKVSCCDGCPLKIAVDPYGSAEYGYYCNYGTFDPVAEAAPADCELRNGDVLVTLVVRR